MWTESNALLRSWERKTKSSWLRVALLRSLRGCLSRVVGRTGQFGLQCVCCCVEVFGDLCFGVLGTLLRCGGLASELRNVSGSCRVRSFGGVALALLLEEGSQVCLCYFAAVPAHPAPRDCVLFGLLAEPGEVEGCHAMAPVVCFDVLQCRCKFGRPHCDAVLGFFGLAHGKSWQS